MADTPPKTMTWSKALPVLAFCIVFDALRAFFMMFWFFGPAIAAAYCEHQVTAAVGSLWGLTSAACSGAATAAGAFGFPVMATFGSVMAMAVGFMGWLAIGGYLLVANARMFGEEPWNSLKMLLALGGSEVPFINALPTLTFTIGSMYRAQIRKEKKELKAWQRRTETRRLALRKRRAQMLAAQMQAQAARDNEAAQEEDTEEIPEERPLAA